MMITLSDALIVQAAMLIFWGGILYQKLLRIEKQIEKWSDHPERIARIETEISNLKKSRA